MFGLEHLTEVDDHDDGLSCAGDIDDSRSEDFSTYMTPMLAEQRAEHYRIFEDFKKDVQQLVLKIDQLDSSVREAATDGAREAIDETLHALMYQTDRARRKLKNEPLDERNCQRMLDHVQELRDNYAAILDASSAAQAGKALDAFEKTLGHLHDHSERTKFRRWKPKPTPEKDRQLKEVIPWPLVFAVSVDSAVDGFLIGLAFSAAESAGWCMSIATSIEMGFLGLSFMATLRSSTRSRFKLGSLAVLPPLVLLFCGLLGQVAGQHFKDEALLFTGFIAFSVVALLFLVTQELLAEAREFAGDDLLVNAVL